MQTTRGQLTEYIEGLELAAPPPEIAELWASGQLGERRRLTEGDDSQDGTGKAAVDAGSLAAFTSEVTPGHQVDAENSILLAQLHADKHFNRSEAKHVLEWYGAYTDVLAHIGWPTQALQFQNYNASGSTFTVNEAIIEIVGAFLVGPELAVVEAALKALKSLASDDPWYKVWDQKSHSTSGGNFQIASCADKGGVLAMRLSAYSFQTSETTTRFLWSEYHASSTKVQYATDTLVMDEDIFGQVRSAISTKLGDAAKQYVGDLDI